MIERIIANLTKVAEGREVDGEEIRELRQRSKWFACVYRLLEVYLIYKRGIARENAKKELEAKWALSAVDDCLAVYNLMYWDIGVLARNFFATKISDYKDNDISEIGTL